jgi:hypothetical protein
MHASVLLVSSLFVWLVTDGWCWFVLKEKYCWLVAGGWFVLREKYCWLVADKPSEQGVPLQRGEPAPTTPPGNLPTSATALRVCASDNDTQASDRRATAGTAAAKSRGERKQAGGHAERDKLGVNSSRPGRKG